MTGSKPKASCSVIYTLLFDNSFIANLMSFYRYEARFKIRSDYNIIEPGVTSITTCLYLSFYPRLDRH